MFLTNSPTSKLDRVYLLVSYVCLSCIPLITWWQGKELVHPGRIVAYELISWLILWAIFKSPRWFHFALIPAFLAAPIEIYLRVYFQQSISSHHLGIITETSPSEALEFLGNKAWLLLAIVVFIVAWWSSLLRSAWRSPGLAWRHVSRWWILALLAICVGPWLLGQYFGLASASTETSADDVEFSSSSTTPQLTEVRSWAQLMNWADQHEPLPAWASIFYDEDSLNRSWPLGILARTYDFVNERRYLATLSEKNRDFRFAAQAKDANFPALTLVLVIGESSRYDRWSLNGYQRDTTPYLRQQENLVSFSDMISPVAATRLSVPIITTRKTALQSLKPGFYEKSLVSAFKEAHFKTYWISNQMSFGQFDTPTSVIAKEADHTQFLNFGGFTNTSSYDQVLLQPLQAALDDPAPHKLIVLHTLGNHWNYSHRHPAIYNKWTPSLYGIANPAYTNLKNKELISNSYDNSLLYTDWFLARVLEQLSKTNASPALFYVSDHGQTIYDGSCNLAFHGHNTQYEFHIPAFMWYSDDYAKRFPRKIEALEQHKDAKLSTENVFHTMLDMADIRYPSEQLSRSIISAQLSRHKRYVDSYGWSDYDNASFKGDCREVIDRGTPLPQDK